LLRRFSAFSSRARSFIADFSSSVKVVLVVDVFVSLMTGVLPCGSSERTAS
jgi:hypothetical protein